MVHHSHRTHPPGSSVSMSRINLEVDLPPVCNRTCEGRRSARSSAWTNRCRLTWHRTLWPEFASDTEFRPHQYGRSLSHLHGPSHEAQGQGPFRRSIGDSLSVRQVGLVCSSRKYVLVELSPPVRVRVPIVAKDMLNSCPTCI